MACFEDIIEMQIFVISNMEASTLLMKEWIWYLAYVTDTRKVLAALVNIFIVKDFLKVFFEELNGLPYQCKVEFVIELETNMVPISQAPY